MKEVFFISSLLNERQSRELSYSIASQLYQLKLTKAYDFVKIFSFVVDPSLSKRKVEQSGNIFYYGFGPSKLKRLLYVMQFTWELAKTIPQGADLLFYNITERNLITYWYFRFVRKQRCFVLLADYGLPSKSKRFRFFHRLLKKSSGLITLSPNIEIHRNFRIQELLIDADSDINIELDCNQQEDKCVLFSGSIGYTTGVHIAIEAMKFLPQYELHISGIMFFDMEEAKLISMVKKSPNKNIFYHGKLSRQQYLKLLERAAICLSLRDHDNDDHLYNFPSKIGEYMWYNKNVISSLKYQGFEAKITYSDWTPEALAETILQLPKVRNDNRSWLLENFGIEAMNKKLVNLFN